jgi:ubiquinone/menaquinone biosynthesis C-methylase UbiE
MNSDMMELLYKTLQQGKIAFSLGHKTIGTEILNRLIPIPSERSTSIPLEILNKIRQRLDDLLTIDWQEAEQGIYPVEIAFDSLWQEFIKYYPYMWLDMPLARQRMAKKEYQVFDKNINTEGYPKYYLQNFHYQTDGYLSDRSADLYDLQVELLFNGGADPMRRRVLAPLKQGLGSFNHLPDYNLNILDVACGTGRTLKFIRSTLPQVNLFGTDLSPNYLKKANELLSVNSYKPPQLIQGNAENLPYRDEYFHGITCVFLFHELPPQARQNVINECARVLKKDGTLIICDSIQQSDSPEFMTVMENFSSIFHEPYYRHYITDDLELRLQEAGLTVIDQQVHFMSKYLIARK